MAHLYSNENFPLPVVEELRKLGHDVRTIQEAGKSNQEYPDDQVLLAAIAEQAPCLCDTANDENRFDAVNKVCHPGRICRSPPDPEQTLTG